MSELDTLAKQFEQLLEGIRDKHSLEEWRYAYRKVIYSGALKIFEVHPEVIIGPSPATLELQARGGPGPGDGPRNVGGNPPPYTILGERPPYRPSAVILQAACIALGNCPPPQT
jgi:hypothetical protein